MFITHGLSKKCPFPGPSEHGALRGPLEPDEAAGALPSVGRPHHGGVLPARRQGERERPGHQPDVRQAQRHHRKISGWKIRVYLESTRLWRLLLKR